MAGMQMWLSYSPPDSPKKFWRAPAPLPLQVIVLLIALVELSYIITALHPYSRVEIGYPGPAKSTLLTIAPALDAFRIDTGRYPTTSEGLQALVQRPLSLASRWKGPYLSKLSNDPWSHSHVYASQSGSSHPYTLLSYGPDGLPGGNDDISLP